MKMLHYTGTQLDPLKNIVYGSTRKEEFIPFLFDPLRNYPIRVEMVGITHPESGYRIERKHSDYFVLEYIVSGSGYVSCNGVTEKVGADDIYLLQPGNAHKYWADKKDPYQKIWINFFSSVFTDIIAAYGLSDRPVFHNSECKPLFDELLDIAQKSNSNDETYLAVSDVLFRIILRLAAKNIGRDDVSDVANRVKYALDNHVYGKVSIEELSEKLNVSRSQMTREFKKYYGVSPYRYVLDRKVEIAKQLLSTSSMHIYEISELLGFSDTYYFTNVFTQKTGLSPSKFRRSNDFRKENANNAPPPASEDIHKI